MQRCIRVLFFLSPLLLLAAFGSNGSAQNDYTPQAQFCANGTATLCSIIPGNIGDDSALTTGVGYQGLIARHPKSAAGDVQTAFDNLSWQTFVALNWTAGREDGPPGEGLQSDGARAWQTWARPGDVFHATSIQANCAVPLGEPVFSFASDGKGNEVSQHEEIVQAATGDPLIDIAGNWTIYERRLNGIEIAYLQAPGGHQEWNLTTAAGQQAFLAASQTVNFPDFTATKTTGAIEIKAAWRVLDLKKHPGDAKRFYVIHALLAVAPDLVQRPRAGRPAPICAQVDLGLVAMHVIQKNLKAKINLTAQWFWSTFEHVDNAPLAANPCDVTAPTQCQLGPVSKPELQSCPPRPPDKTAPEYSYFNKTLPQVVPPLAVNQPPTASPGDKFFWSPEQPFAARYLKSVAGKRIGTQVARCWNIYETTGALNTQWQDALAKVGSVFSNYMLVSTQWGTTYETQMKLPLDAAPNLLSNTVVETYMQNAYDPNDAFSTGSCISCHSVATFNNSKVSTDLSFLPGLVKPEQVRRAPLLQPAH